MKNLIITFLLFNISTVLFAKDDWVITAKGDTLRGKVVLRTGQINSIDQVIVKQDKKKNKFPVTKVRRVILGNDENFVPIKIDGRYQFAQVIMEGSYLSYYMYVDATSKDKTAFESPLLATIDGQQHKISSISFRVRILAFLTDCDEVREKISSHTYKRKDLIVIIEEYNTCIVAKSNMAYEPPPPTEQASDIDQLISLVNQEAAIETKEDLIAMLEDIKNKLNEGKEIPSYLKSAVLESLSGNDDLIKLFEEAVK